MFERLKEDIQCIMERDPAARTPWQVVTLYPGFRAIRSHRVANWFHRRGMKYIAQWIAMRARRKTGIEIHPAATIGKRVFIDHGSGVVIGETAEIGDDCTLYQGVTLGGTGKIRGKRHPTLGNNVVVGSGAKILGPFKVGDNSKIASNAVVLIEVPPNSTCVGIPARIVRQEGKNFDLKEIDLNHVNIPDPISNEISRLEARILQLEALLGEKET